MDSEHRHRGMENGLAYHFVIGNGVNSNDGEIEITKRWIEQISGGHVYERPNFHNPFNTYGIGISIICDEK